MRICRSAVIRSRRVVIALPHRWGQPPCRTGSVQRGRWRERVDSARRGLNRHEGPGAGYRGAVSFNELEAALAPPATVTYLPNSQDGDPLQRQKQRPAAAPDLKNPGLFRSSVGVLADGDQIRGAGADYKITFEPGSIAYIPALPPAPHNMPVEFRLQAYGRGTASTVPSSALLNHSGNTIAYVRPEFTEHWELRPEGAKQSFVFDSLPAGDGDLVVRMQLTTELQPRQDGPDSMSLNLEGIGGVTIKDVIGIDKNGVRIQGSLHYDGGALELRLPDEAVDRAALPLVLDPIVGTTLTVISSTYNTYDSDAAFDEAANLWLVVYTRQFSATDYDTHGQRVNSTGTLNGSLVLIDNSSSTVDTNARVSTINSQNCFAVVWRRDNGTADDIYGKAVRAADAALSTTTLLVTSANNLGQPDVGGEATTVDNEAILVWTDFTTDEINAKQVSILGNTAPTLPTITPFTAVVLIGDASATWTNSTPAISESGGDTGNHCIVWMRQFTTSTNTAVRAAIVSRNLTILDSFVSVADTASGDNDNPDVDGNGRNWVVAWDREATSGNGDPGIFVRAIGWNPNAVAPNQGYLVSGTVVVEDDAGDAEFTPAVAWTGDAVLVAYVDTATAPDDDIFANLIDLYTCALCRSSDYIIDASIDDADSPGIASGRSGGESSVRSLITYRWNDVTSPSGTNPDIRAIRYDADEGTISNLNGGCGTGGTHAGSCAVSPNPTFALRLRGGPVSATTLLVISPTSLNLLCGACTLVPNPYTGFVSVGATNSLGDLNVTLGIPASVIGASIVSQFITVGTNCFGGYDLSNALRTTVQ